MRLIVTAFFRRTCVRSRSSERTRSGRVWCSGLRSPKRPGLLGLKDAVVVCGRRGRGLGVPTTIGPGSYPPDVRSLMKPLNLLAGIMRWLAAPAMLSTRSSGGLVTRGARYPALPTLQPRRDASDSASSAARPRAEADEIPRLWTCSLRSDEQFLKLIAINSPLSHIL
jgi:hypothetical protein